MQQLRGYSTHKRIHNTFITIIIYLFFFLITKHNNNNNNKGKNIEHPSRVIIILRRDGPYDHSRQLTVVLFAAAVSLEKALCVINTVISASVCALFYFRSKIMQ